MSARTKGKHVKHGGMEKQTGQKTTTDNTQGANKQAQVTRQSTMKISTGTGDLASTQEVVGQVQGPQPLPYNNAQGDQGATNGHNLNNPHQTTANSVLGDQAAKAQVQGFVPPQVGQAQAARGQARAQANRNQGDQGATNGHNSNIPHQTVLGDQGQAAKAQAQGFTPPQAVAQAQARAQANRNQGASGAPQANDVNHPTGSILAVPGPGDNGQTPSGPIPNPAPSKCTTVLVTMIDNTTKYDIEVCENDASPGEGYDKITCDNVTYYTKITNTQPSSLGGKPKPKRKINKKPSAKNR